MKAILLFDINDLTYEALEDGFINELTLHLRDNGFYEIKDVELKPIPQKKYVDEDLAKYCEEYDREIGWNACIDEILGEKQ